MQDSNAGPADDRELTTNGLCLASRFGQGTTTTSRKPTARLAKTQLDGWETRHACIQYVAPARPCARLQQNSGWKSREMAFFFPSEGTFTKYFVSPPATLLSWLDTCNVLQIYICVAGHYTGHVLVHPICRSTSS